MKRASITLLDKQIADLAKYVTLVGQLAKEYAGVALVGSFADQVEKSIKLLETNVEEMRTAGKDVESMKRAEVNLAMMKEWLTVLCQTQAQQK